MQILNWLSLWETGHQYNCSKLTLGFFPSNEEEPIYPLTPPSHPHCAKVIPEIINDLWLHFYSMCWKSWVGLVSIPFSESRADQTKQLLVLSKLDLMELYWSFINSFYIYIPSIFPNLGQHSTALLYGNLYFVCYIKSFFCYFCLVMVIDFFFQVYETYDFNFQIYYLNFLH